jgi:hypothetical protein
MPGPLHEEPVTVPLSRQAGEALPTRILLVVVGEHRIDGWQVGVGHRAQRDVSDAQAQVEEGPIHAVQPRRRVSLLGCRGGVAHLGDCDAQVEPRSGLFQSAGGSVTGQRSPCGRPEVPPRVI